MSNILTIAKWVLDNNKVGQLVEFNGLDSSEVYNTHSTLLALCYYSNTMFKLSKHDEERLIKFYLNHYIETAVEDKI